LSIQVALNHVTHYRYDRAVWLSPQLVRLRPAPHCRTRILAYSQRITPAAHFINWQQDPQSNFVARVVFPEQVRELRVEVDLVVETAVHNPFDFFLEPDADHVPFAYTDAQNRELQPFLQTEDMTPRLRDYLGALPRERRRTIDTLVDINQRLQRDIRYAIRYEPGVQTPEQTLTLGSGSCRDSAWLLVQVLRRRGLAARFVSGYLIQLVADGVEGPRGPDRDFTDLHAWCEVYLPGAGWIGLDPTSGLLTGDGHLPLVCTPDPSSAAPVSGTVEPCEVTLEHTTRVERVLETRHTSANPPAENSSS
jgi:transglutaminase-like putative cysteine protease